MTGVNGGRPELIIKGSNDYNEVNGEGTWKEYEFYYKPTAASEMPKFIMPHQPRFDWQLWFSALAPNIDGEYYLVHFLYKLFKKDKVALSLLSKDPFEGENLKYLKIELEHY